MKAPTTAELADRIAAFVQRSDWVSQEEICSRCVEDGEDLNLRGNMAMVLPGANVALHYCVSKQFIEAMGLLRDERPRRIVPVPASILTMMVDGVPWPVGVPIVKRAPPEGGFKKEHYLPVTYRAVSKMTIKERKKFIPGDYAKGTSQ